MTRAEIAARVSTNLGENSTFYSSDDFIASIQDGYDEIAAFTGIIEKATSLTLTANTYHDLRTLVPDFVSVIGIWNTSTKRYLKPVSLLYLENCREDWEICPGTIECFWPINFRYIATFRQSIQEIYLFYRASAPTLASDTSILIADEHLRVLMDYSSADLLETTQDFDTAFGYLNNYISGLENLRQSVRNNLDSGAMRMLK